LRGTLRAAGFLLDGLELVEEFDPADGAFLAIFQSTASAAFIA
jgi:hypothetical protein